MSVPSDRLGYPRLRVRHSGSRPAWLAWRGVLQLLLGLRPGMRRGGGSGLTMADDRYYVRPDSAAAATRISHGLSE